jgi:hypothetical protein
MASSMKSFSFSSLSIDRFDKSPTTYICVCCYCSLSLKMSVCVVRRSKLEEHERFFRKKRERKREKKRNKID